jgi:hypothetical protein
LFTSSKTSRRNLVPRTTVFRAQYADVNQHITQGQLFPVRSSPGEAALYCIIIHGPSTEKPGELGYCCFAFPTQQGKEWVQEPIDLSDIRDYQQARYQKPADDRALIQNTDPVLKPKFDAGSQAEETA